METPSDLSAKASYHIELYDNAPDDFTPLSELESVICYVEADGKFLWLQNSSKKSDPGCWGAPGGKIEANETVEQTACREIEEETGIKIDPKTQLQALGALYFSIDGYKFVSHLFKIVLEKTCSITLSSEHQNYTWLSQEEVKQLNLIPGAKQAFKHYLKRSTKKIRSGASVNAYLILRDEDKVLLLLRRNTGYCDGMYSLIAGHVEDEESATAAIIREAKEEAGIDLIASHLRVVHVLHRQTARFNVDIFFEATSWHGIVSNQESHVCEELAYFPLADLPANTIPYIRSALTSVANRTFYSEEGWTYSKIPLKHS